MKIWTSFGSEHSMNLVMIGRFREVQDASEAKRVIDELTNQVNEDCGDDRESDRFSDELLELLQVSRISSVSRNELDQHAYDVHVEARGTDVVITTDEVDVSALLKILLEKGARIEVYSAHEYPDTGLGR